MGESKLAAMIRRNAGAVDHPDSYPSREAMAADPDQGPDAGYEVWRHLDPDGDEQSAMAYDPTQGGGFPPPDRLRHGVDTDLLPMGADVKHAPVADRWTRERPTTGWMPVQYAIVGNAPAVQIAAYNRDRRALMVVCTAGSVVLGPSNGSIPNMGNGLPLPAVAKVVLPSTDEVWAFAATNSTVTIVQLFDSGITEAGGAGASWPV